MASKQKTSLKKFRGKLRWKKQRTLLQPKRIAAWAPSSVMLKSVGTHTGTSRITMEPAHITEKTIESCTVAMHRTLKQGGMKVPKNHMSVFVKATRPYTKKPTGVRMGKGKGSISLYKATVSPGTRRFELNTEVPGSLSKKALVAAQAKLGVKTKIIYHYLLDSKMMEIKKGMNV